MKLKPMNNWIQVDPSCSDVEESEPSLIALPDDYRPTQKPHKSVSVVSDPESVYQPGEVLVVPAHLIHEIELKEDNFYLLERNHVMAVIL
tara:strand:- start:806 stop:1075 length:270 start_codon:yes stop_codon:yes gene_type:complete